MKKLLFILPALALAACAPAQGAKPLVYQGESGAILAAAAQLCPTLQAGKNTNYFSVVSVTPTTVVCTTTPTPFFAALVGNITITLTLTALPNGNTTTVAGSEDWGKAAPNTDALLALYAGLDRKFTRLP